MNRLPSTSWQRVVVLAVHPDDESLSAGGLIQQAVARGADVRVIVITDGDNNPWPQRFVERRWWIDAAARARWGERRGGEAVVALACLGVPRENVSFWHYPDQGLTEILLTGNQELIARLSAVIRQWRPTLLVIPSMRDLHPDHNALAVLVYFTLGQRLFSPYPSFAVLEYLVHARGVEVPGEDFQIDLSPGQVTRKREAILSHATQMALSRRRFLAFAKRAESFLVPTSPQTVDDSHPVFSAEIKESFLCLKLRHLSSPATLFIAAGTGEGVLRQSVSLSSGTAPAVCEYVSGEIRGHGRIDRGRDYDELHLPSELYASRQSLFVKVVTRGGFFDRSGWRVIPLESARASAEEERNARLVKPRICCVIPCFNLAGICGPIVRAAAGFADHVIAVNDGSKDETERVLREVAEECDGRVEVLSLSNNCGKGIALLEAFRRALNTLSFDVLVTLDGDGQHRPEDIPRLAQATVGGDYSLVIGERLAREKMPLRSRVGNTLTAVVMKLFHPAAPTDTQSGLRAFDRDFVREIVETIEGGRYETELEVLLLALQQGRRIGSVTIPTVYLDGNRLSHFRPLIDSWRIYRTLFRWQFYSAGHRVSKAPLVAHR